MTDKEIALKRVNRQVEMLTKDIEQYSNHSNGELRNACITYRKELAFYKTLHDALTSPATSRKSCEGLVKALEFYANKNNYNDIVDGNCGETVCITPEVIRDDGCMAEQALAEHRKNMGVG